MHGQAPHRGAFFLVAGDVGTWEVEFRARMWALRSRMFFRLAAANTRGILRAARIEAGEQVLGAMKEIGTILMIAIVLTLVLIFPVRGPLIPSKHTTPGAFVGSFDRRISDGFTYQFIVDGSPRRLECYFCPFAKIPKGEALRISVVGLQVTALALRDGRVIDEQSTFSRRARWIIFCALVLIGPILYKLIRPRV